MKNSDMPVTPTVNDNGHPFHHSEISGQTGLLSGLTKREHLAGLAMQGILANSGAVIQANNMGGSSWCNTDSNGMAALALECADALLSALEEGQS